jgi:hypothetical protein
MSSNELTTQLGTMVRSWVHFDNLAATFNRQAQQARSARAKWEQQILDTLRSSSMMKAIIQISGGTLTVVEEKHSQPITLQRLEALLHQYYNKKAIGSDDETSDIMQFIKTNREYVIETKIKKS